MKRWICILLLLALAILPAGAEAQPAANWYEVFVRSYQDSDGDGLGDLNGLRSRLDYIADMGWRGIWLMPVMPSPSYHKYDVTDYRAIDPEYGTLEDMRALVSACHERGIALIVDLPVNHTSTLHPWFQTACDALREGGAENPCVGYFNFARGVGDHRVPVEGTDWSYEEQFSGGGMPDLNLLNPAVMDELRGIFDFWLNDIGVDGFRLDAVTSYVTGDTAANIVILAQLKAMAEALKPDSFLVGECWANLNTIADYYASGVDSFFLFPASQAEGFIAASLRGRGKRAEKFAAAWEKVLAAIPKGWLTPFLCNHDTGRTVGLVQGRSYPAAAKFAEGVLGILGGSAFTYYGEEIGMAGSGDDPNKRLAMYWSDSDMTLQPPGATQIEYPFPCVEVQQDDPGSLLNYVKAVNHMRLAHPAISTGRNTFALAEGNLCLMLRETEEERCMIAVNFSNTEAGQFDVTGWALDIDLETGDAVATLERSEDAATLTLPPWGIAVLIEAE